MFMSDWSALKTPEKATLDRKRTLSFFITYRRLSSQVQFSLSPVALEMYLYGHTSDEGEGCTGLPRPRGSAHTVNVAISVLQQNY
jgi:hypothetical protein